MNIKALVVDRRSTVRNELSQPLKQIGVRKVVEMNASEAGGATFEAGEFDVIFVEFNTLIEAGETLVQRLRQQGFLFPALVHPRAQVEPSATIAAGAQVFGMASVGAAAGVGFGAIVNTGAIVSHDCQIEEYAHVAPGAVLAGNVRVGRGALVGDGAAARERRRRRRAPPSRTERTAGV